MTHLSKRTLAVPIWPLRFTRTIIVTMPFVIAFCITNKEVYSNTSRHITAPHIHLQPTIGFIHVSTSDWKANAKHLRSFMIFSIDSVGSALPFPFDKLGIYASGLQKLGLFLAA